MTPIIKGIRENKIHTLTIDMSLPGLDIIEDFMVCPISPKSKSIKLINDTSYVEVDHYGNGVLVQNEPGTQHLSFDALYTHNFRFASSDWEQIKAYIPLTTGIYKIADGLMIDNSGAKTFFD